MPSAAISCARLSSSSVPSKRIEPSAGSASRLTQLKRVVLPAPLGPISPQTLPSPTVKVGVVQRGDAAEPDCESRHFEQWSLSSERSVTPMRDRLDNSSQAVKSASQSGRERW